MSYNVCFMVKVEGKDEWAEMKGINRSTLNNRIYRGWDIEKALTKGAM